MKETAKNKSYFLEIFDIAKYAVLVEDERTCRRAIQMLMEDMYTEINTQLENNVTMEKGICFSEVQIDLMRQILNMTCKPDNNFFTHDSMLVNIWFPLNQYVPLSDDAWNFIWYFVTNVVDAGKEDWLISYWTFADQYYRFTLKDNVKALHDENLKSQNLRFKQFHLGLCAYMLYREKYSLLKKILYFTQTIPPTYSLIDNTFEEIVSDMDRIYRLKEYSLLLTKMYRMSGLDHDVNSDVYVAGKFNQYFTLLLVRLNDMDYNVSYRNPLAFPQIKPDAEIHELKAQIRYADILIHFLNAETFSQMLSEFGYNSNYREKSLDLVNKYRNEIAKVIDDKIHNPQTDPEKIALIKSNLISEIHSQKLYLPMKTSSKIKGDIEYEEYFCGQSLEVSIEDLAKYQDRLSANMEEALVEAMLMQERASYNRFFYYNRPVATYTIRFKDLMKAWEKLGVDKNFTILSMGVYLGTFTDLYGKHSSFEYTNGKGNFNGAVILGLHSSMRAFVIIPTENLPYVEHREIAGDELDGFSCIDEETKLYSNVENLDAKENKILAIARKNRLVHKRNFTKYILLKVSYSSDCSLLDLDNIESLGDFIAENNAK